MYLTTQFCDAALKLHLGMWNGPKTYEDHLLDAKGFIESAPLKLADMSAPCVRVEVSTIGEPYRIDRDPDVIFISQDYTEFDELLIKYPEFKPFLCKAKDLDELNLYTSQALCAVSSPIYSSQPLSLIALKSQHAKQDILVGEPSAAVSVAGIPLVYNNDGMLSGMWGQGFRSLLQGLEGELKSVDIEKAFIQSVTSRSSGTLPFELTERIKARFNNDRNATKFAGSKIGLLGLSAEIITEPDQWALAADVPPKYQYESKSSDVRE
jgi:hypothetical protein